MAEFENDNENSAIETSYSEELVPLKQRLRKLVASRGLTFESDVEWDNVVKAFTPKLSDAVTEKRENKLPDSPEMAQFENDNVNSATETLYSEELVPFKQRIRKLVASRGLTFKSDVEWHNVFKAFTPKLGDAVTEKRENKLPDSQEMAQFENDNENSATETSYSEELVPFKQRIRKLVASGGLTFESDVEWDNVFKAFTPKLGDTVTEKRGNKLPDSLEMAQFENDNEDRATETSYSEELVPFKQRIRKLVASRGLTFESDVEWDSVFKAFTPKLGDTVTEKRENKLPDSLEMAQLENDNENSATEMSYSEELVPFKQRIRKLVASRGLTFESDVEWDNVFKACTPKLGDAVTEKRENKLPDSPGMAQFENDNVNSDAETSYSEEVVPFKQRIRKLVASRGLTFESDVEWDNVFKAFTPKLGDAVTEKRHLYSGCSAEQRMIEAVSREERHADKQGKCNHQESLWLKHENSSQTIAVAYTSERVHSVDELDNLVLKERLMRILSSESLKLKATATEGNSPGASLPVSESSLHQTAGSRKGELTYCEQKLPVSGDSWEIPRNDGIHSSGKTCSKSESNCGKAFLSGDIRSAQGSTMLNLASIKVKPPNCNDCESFNLSTADQISFWNSVPMKKEIEIPGDLYEDELDNMLLRERMKLLSPKNVPNINIPRSSECLNKIGPSALSWNPIASESTQLPKVNRPRKRQKTVKLVGLFKSMTTNPSIVMCKENSPGASLPDSESSFHQTAGSRKGELTYCDQKLPVSGDSWEIPRNDGIHSSGKNCSKSESNCGKAFLSGDIRSAQGSSMLNLANIKVEPPYCNDSESFNLSTADQISFWNSVPMKKEIEIPGDLYEDELDHMLLRERMKLLSPKNVPNINIPQGSECLSKIGPSALSWNPIASESTQFPKVNHPRKRRKTVTDSIETALEEDAPGLLQMLIENGVSVDEIKLYGESENNDTFLDDSSTKDNFAELEAVITKLFTRRDSLLKLGPFRCAKGEKASYCLACLFSLVEQARYLQFRNWPVEWGWCRDLQSFIFVFERHNRIVLERPEYGYATYFFQLEDSLPIDWQIKRLVTAMKLTSCSRVTLIENKALMLGDDLTEREARVLMEYGWIPNTGLGTMLHYYDRVVHDRKNEKYSSEWSLKIGKLLMDGYNGGRIISTGIPRKVVDNNAAHPQEIKLELN